MPPTLHLSCAVSADGFLDDTAEARAVLSSPEDLDAVLALRARMDMIVVGAQTLRRDDPSLATRGAVHEVARQRGGRAPHPVKVVVSRSGDVPRDRRFFRDGDAEKIVLSRHFGTGRDLADALRAIASERGLSDILVEGGAQMLRMLLPEARFLRLAVGPQAFGPRGHARLIKDPIAFAADQLVRREETLGGTRVFHIDLLATRLRPLMERAFDLSERCPASDTAFAVGAVACDAELAVLATGYSRETGPADHAEEAMLSKLPEHLAPPHTVVCTLEPCLSRASKPTGCAERLVAAGVRRVAYAVAEDETFTRQSGLAYLRDHGVALVHLPGFEARFRAVNAAVYGGS